jgi:anaerobic magnesium-protoporphyrin IX monomethyl ester cyclase
MQNFRVLLVYPNMQMVNLLPSNISILSACLKKSGVTVDLFDTTLYPTEKESVDDKRVEYLQLRPFDYSQYGIHYKESDVFGDFVRKIEKFRPDLIAVTVVEDTFPFAIKLLESVSGFNIPVIAGGVQTILAPEMVLENNEIDMICYGEGEEALPELCNRMSSGLPVNDIRNIWIKYNGGIIKNPMRPLVNLNEIPYNDFFLFEESRLFRPMQGKIFRMIPIEIDRGCPYQCTFCAAPSLRDLYKKETSGTYHRLKTIPRVIEELIHQVATYHAEYIYFNSETFLAMNDEKFQTFAEEYLEKINLPFWCQSRVETISEFKIALLEKMGCDRLSIGIEHGNEEFRRTVLKKKFTNQQVLEAFTILKHHKIPITVNNMLGFPGETRDLIFDTIHLNRQINIDSTNCFAFKPYHGTYLREIAIRDGYLKESGNVHSILESSMDMPQLSKVEIEGLLRTFPLYIKMPENRFPEIQIAEKNTNEGNAMYSRLAKEYQQTYW